MFAIVTGHTCGEACWYARDAVCRCSCGGENHGCLNVAGAARPARTCQIKGHRYQLIRTGRRSDLWSEFCELMRSAPPRMMGGHSFAWTEYSSNDGGAPYVLKAASESQCNAWGELTAYKGLDRVQRYHASPALIWQKIG